MTSNPLNFGIVLCSKHLYLNLKTDFVVRQTFVTSFLIFFQLFTALQLLAMTPSFSDQTTFWSPSPHHIHNSNLSSFVTFLNTNYNTRLPEGNQSALHHWSITNTNSFWHAVATFLSFPLHPKPTLGSVVTSAKIPNLPDLVNVHWFRGSHTNFAAAFLHRGLDSPRNIAIVYSPESLKNNRLHRVELSYGELRVRVLTLASALYCAGIRKGHSVAGILSAHVDAVVCLLAAAAVGAVWSCCSPEFGDRAISSRLSQTKPKVLFYTPAYIYNGRAHDISSKLEKVFSSLPSLKLIISVPQSHTSCKNAHVPCSHYSIDTFERRFADIGGFELASLSMRDPVVTMFSSGTTGVPKCIVQGAGILLNQMKEHALHMEITSSSTVFFHTTTGWMLFNWLVAALAGGAKIILYDGSPFPSFDPFRLVRLATEESITHFGCSATYLLLLKRVFDRSTEEERALGKSLSTICTVLGTGSPSTLTHFQFVKDFFPPGVQYVSMSGGSEINGCFALGSPWKVVQAPYLQCAGLGMNVATFDGKGSSVVERTGELVCLNACPCMPLYFAHDPDHTKFRKAYFSQFGNGVWCHGDFARLSATGAFVISGRSDSTLNPGGVRIGTADIYDVIDVLDFVHDVLVTEVVIQDEVKMIMFVVVSKDGVWNDDKIQCIRTCIRKSLSPKHLPFMILRVTDIPYTFSGKKCEIPVKNLLRDGVVSNVESVRNPAAFEFIRTVAQSNGLVGRPAAVTGSSISFPNGKL